jgi:GntR family carbon starvation induced transcriptional regulator
MTVIIYSTPYKAINFDKILATAKSNTEWLNILPGVGLASLDGDRGNPWEWSMPEGAVTEQDGWGEQPAKALSTSVYHQLRSDLLAGRLRPGEKLRAEGLRQRFKIGSSPIREALNRLLSEGFVSLEDQKGFRVAPVSESELQELVLARGWIDGIAITESIRKFDVAWEEALVLALHRLSKVSRRSNVEAGPDGVWERLHRDFHCALVSGCGSRWIRRISEQLFDAAERYRLLAAGQISERNELDEHRAIVEACLARNAPKAVELLEGHFRMTFSVIVHATKLSAESAG